MRWYKNVARRDEIAMLMQGLELPSPRLCATSTLPPVMEQPTSPPPLPVEPFEFHEPVDTYGPARVRRRGSTSSMPPPLPPGSSTTPDILMPATTATTTCTRAVPITPVLATMSMPSVTTPVPDVTTVPLPAAEVTIVNVSRTTKWRHEKGLGVSKTP